MKPDVTEQIYSHYVQLPRRRELQELYGYEESKAWRNSMADAIKTGDDSKVRDLALFMSGKAEKVGFMLGIEIGIKLMCETLGEWEPDAI